MIIFKETFSRKIFDKIKNCVNILGGQSIACLKHLQAFHFSGLSRNSRFTTKELLFSGLMVFIMQSVVIKSGNGNSVMTTLSLYFNLLLPLN